MNDLKELLREKKIYPISIEQKGKVIIIEEKDKKIVIKKNNNNYDIYKYLLSRRFDAFPKIYSNIHDEDEIMEYIDNLFINKEQRINDLLILLAELHLKTSYDKELELNEIENIYAEIKKQIIDAKNYYLKINDIIDQTLFLSPSMYLIVRNISLIYLLLDKALQNLELWKEKITSNKQITYALVYNNVSIDHLLINNRKYLISWDKAYFGMPIFDIENFYHKYYYYIGLKECLNVYESINKLNDSEKELLIIKLSLPNIVRITDNHFLDTKKIRCEIDYLKRIEEYYRSID